MQLLLNGEDRDNSDHDEQFYQGESVGSILPAPECLYALDDDSYERRLGCDYQLSQNAEGKSSVSPAMRQERDFGSQIRILVSLGIRNMA